MMDEKENGLVMVRGLAMMNRVSSEEDDESVRMMDEWTGLRRWVMVHGLAMDERCVSFSDGA